MCLCPVDHNPEPAYALVIHHAEQPGSFRQSQLEGLTLPDLVVGVARMDG